MYAIDGVFAYAEQLSLSMIKVFDLAELRLNRFIKMAPSGEERRT